MAEGGKSEPTEPLDAYDSKHGKPAPDRPTANEAELWGTRENPVIETPAPFGSLRDK